ncbi:hypothetical protein HPB51_006839 [Rhipicephalus microplus]|uniref:Uncharacterized protein n=1 Tax=Rhipicephalus microplus TaxID=6941 RepID=A0A9J6E7S4_RHIMP|nr:hypothetical protein HPB51_006839 [Rhipicephalus microplus]
MPGENQTGRAAASGVRSCRLAGSFKKLIDESLVGRACGGEEGGDRATVRSAPKLVLLISIVSLADCLPQQPDRYLSDMFALNRSYGCATARPSCDFGTIVIFGDSFPETLARRATLESALLEPLMVLYKRRLKEELGRGVRLHGDYGNAELFFVLWALNHCGELDAETIVNGALRNSALFARAFQCSVNQAMWSGMRCSFWH